VPPLPPPAEILKAALQIVLLAVPLYFLLKFLRRSRGFPILAGLLSVLLVLYGAAQIFDLDALRYILNRGWVWIPALLVVVFQPELRRIFANIGGTHPRAVLRKEAAVGVVSQLAKAFEALQEEKIGAIVAIEREESLAPFTTGGRWIDAPVNAELLLTVFYPGTALHDGGVIVRGDRIAWAGCIFPLAMDERRRAFGTRHRAAVGLSERSDAIVVVVSEETGRASVAYRGELVRGVSHNSLVQILGAAFEPGAEAAPPLAAAEGEAPDAAPDRVARAIEAAKEDF
jgi:diadenylate cyclase